MRLGQCMARTVCGIMGQFPVTHHCSSAQESQDNTMERWTVYHETPHAPESVYPQSWPPRGVMAAPRGVAVVAVRYPLLPGAGAARGSGVVRFNLPGRPAGAWR